MSIDTQVEDLITLSDAAKCFPGRAVAIQTMHRWRLNGVRGNKLETCLIGGIRWTSHQAIQRFIAAQNAGDSTEQSTTPKQRQRQSDAARRELAEMGV
jgi:hypothetical protein